MGKNETWRYEASSFCRNISEYKQAHIQTAHHIQCNSHNIKSLISGMMAWLCFSSLPKSHCQCLMGCYLAGDSKRNQGCSVSCFVKSEVTQHGDQRHYSFALSYKGSYHSACSTDSGETPEPSSRCWWSC